MYSQKAKSNIFWEHVFKAYRLLYYRIEPQNTSELLAEPVLHNDRIKIGNKVISYTQWIEKGVYNLANFVGNTGKLLTVLLATVSAQSPSYKLVSFTVCSRCPILHPSVKNYPTSNVVRDVDGTSLTLWTVSRTCAYKMQNKTVELD